MSVNYLQSHIYIDWNMIYSVVNLFVQPVISFPENKMAGLGSVSKNVFFEIRCLNTTVRCFNTSTKCFNTTVRCFNTPTKYFNTTIRCFNTPIKCFNTTVKCFNTPIVPTFDVLCYVFVWSQVDFFILFFIYVLINKYFLLYVLKLLFVLIFYYYLLFVLVKNKV